MDVQDPENPVNIDEQKFAGGEVSVNADGSLVIISKDKGGMRVYSVTNGTLHNQKTDITTQGMGMKLADKKINHLPPLIQTVRLYL